MNTRPLAFVVLLFAAACPGPTTGGPDLTTKPPPDLREAPDQAVADLLSLPDGSATDGPSVVVCNLGNDPLPCTSEAICTGNGATCDTGKRYCVCITPNCTPGNDSTCNDNPGIDAFHGHCTSFGACMCLDGFGKSPRSGKCL